MKDSHPYPRKLSNDLNVSSQEIYVGNQMAPLFHPLSGANSGLHPFLLFLLTGKVFQMRLISRILPGIYGLCPYGTCGVLLHFVAEPPRLL